MPVIDRRRQGTALIIAMICLLLASALTVSLVQVAVLQREQVLRDEWQLQAEWLAESALDRAAARLVVEPEYAGESWRPQLPGEAEPLGRVEIAVERPTETGRVQVTAVADVPDDPDERARVRKSVIVLLNNER